MLPGTRPALVAIALVSVTACGGGGDTPPPATPPPATHFLVTAPSTGYTRASLPIAVTALDAFNKPTTNYDGSVLITSSDAKALLPGVAVAVHGGGGSFNATLESVGTQTLTATDSVHASVAGTSAPIAVSTAPGIAITSGPPPGGVVGSRYSPRKSPPCTYRCGVVYNFPLSAAGGLGIFTWTWAAAPGSSLPPGLSINGNLIEGTPPIGSVGIHKVIVTATDGGTPAAQASTDYTISIVNPPLPIIATQPGPPGATLNQPYSYQFQVSGSGPVFSETGALPPGLAQLTAAGVLAGTPTTANLYPITVRAVDQAGQDASQAFTIGVFQHGFRPTGGLPGIRTLHTATLLASGQVLVAGGGSNDGASIWLQSSELFTPASGSFVASGPMQIARSYHTATLLCDLAVLPCTDPKVLIVGGDAGTGAIQSAELYDPVTGTFTLALGSLGTARYGHTATRLQSGKVLIAGGNSTSGTAASAELFDPATGTFSATATPMTSARFFHTATLLPDGRVLIVGGGSGGTTLDSAEIFDPVTRAFSKVPSPMTVAREGHTATLLPDGKVLIAGGLDSNYAAVPYAELYDPSARAPAASFAVTGALVTPRWIHAAVLLPGGQVLIAGGTTSDQSTYLQHAELYDPASGLFRSTGSMQDARVNHTLTLLGSSGKVLVVGGDSGLALSTAEIYQ